MFLRSIINNRIPGQLVVQMTDRCNANCPQCGMRVTASFPRSTLETDRIRAMIDQAAERGFRAISFTGGEPLLDLPRLVALIRHAGHAGMTHIRTGTNGFPFKNPQGNDFEGRVARMVDLLADTPLRNFWISMDSGIDAIHEQMRGFPGVVAGIARALPLFHAAGLFPAVNLGINRQVGGGATRDLRKKPDLSEEAYLDRFYHRYRRAFERFYRRAVDLGFTMANTCYPMSIDAPECQKGLSAVYAATTAADIVRFSPPEKRMLFKALGEAIRRFRPRLRIFSPLCSLEALVRQYESPPIAPPAYGCRGGVDFFFINASDGHVYPCGYRGNDDLGDLERLDLERLKPAAEADACRRCDWECFRDPSELFGPLLDSLSRPLAMLRRIAAQPTALATWMRDLRYYQACDFFDGRRPPNYERMKPFGRGLSRSEREKQGLDEFRRLNRKLSVS